MTSKCKNTTKNQIKTNITVFCAGVYKCTHEIKHTNKYNKIIRNFINNCGQIDENKKPKDFKPL